MSFLYPLFLAGIAAVSLPIILHMIRRQTRKRVSFSSLMFLHTTVPRFKKRSHLENLPLLILRCIILCLLAFAFSRPFFPRQEPGPKVSPTRRIVLLIDTSASMRRTGIWNQAISEAQSALKNAKPTDRVCVIRFGQGTDILIGFEQWNEMDSSRRIAVATEQISNLSPGWGATNLGDALVTAAETIQDDEINDEQSTGWPSSQKFKTSQIVLISDLQKGSSLDALQSYEWPEALELQVRTIAAAGTTNASMQLIAGRDQLARKDGDELPSIRITNTPDAKVERFSLSWAGEDSGEISDRGKEIYVPAGHSVVTKIPKRADNSVQGKSTGWPSPLLLTGDDHDFDNTLYMAPHLINKVNILFIGGDVPGDSKGMLYYVQRAFRPTGSVEPVVISRSAENITDADIMTAHLIITADVIAPERVDSVRRYLETGRTVLLVIRSAEAVKTITQLTGIENIDAHEADIDTYSMLGRLEYKHPLLVPFSEPRFGDFTKIHFWKHRRINTDNLPGAEVLARFDNNDPALFEIRAAKEPALGNSKGSLLVLTSGWHPSDSQLALSSKFVPLLYSILEYGGIFTNRRSQYFVGDNIALSLQTESANLEIRRPDDSVVRLNPDEESFTQTDQPGIYTLRSSAGNYTFALNLPASECRTEVMPIEDLEILGVSLAQSSEYSTENAELSAGSRNIRAGRNSSFAGMESEQKIWRLILILLLAVSFMEITLAGWFTRSPSNLEAGKT